MPKRAMVKYEKNIHFVIHGEVQRPWGYEIRVAIFDDEEKHLHSACISWPSAYGEPDEKERLSKVILKLVEYKEKRDNPGPEPEPAPDYLAEAEKTLLQVLVARGYLRDGEVLDDLPDFKPVSIEIPRWRQVWNFLSRPLWSS